MSPTESVILISYILNTVGSWRRPSSIGEGFLTLACNYDLSLVSNSTFILTISGDPSINKSSY